MHAGCGFLAHALAELAGVGPAVGLIFERLGEQLQDDLVFLVVGRIGARHFARGFKLGALVNQQRDVPTVVDDLIRAFAVAEVERALGAPPILFQRFALPRKHRHARRRINGALRPNNHRSGGVILRAEDVA